MFQRSIKKQMKLRALLATIGDTSREDCLLITCGDNAGALNWHFRNHGGRWVWADVTGENLAEVRDFLSEPVHHVQPDDFPFADGQFDSVIAIDVLEHLHGDQPFLHELWRVLRPNGRAVITVPNGDPALFANQIKQRIGMTPEKYGHTRAGYSMIELQETVRRAGFTPIAQSGYSRLFTELIELGINFGYVYLLSRKRDVSGSNKIAPTTSHELKRHGTAYKLYSLIYPVANLFSKLDGLLPEQMNNAVIVVGRKQEQIAA